MRTAALHARPERSLLHAPPRALLRRLLSRATAARRFSTEASTEASTDASSTPKLLSVNKSTDGDYAHISLCRRRP